MVAIAHIRTLNVVVVWLGLLIYPPIGYAGVFKRDLPANRAGREAYARQRYDEAARDFERAARELTGEERFRAVFNRGSAMFQAGRLDEAEQAFGEAARTADVRLLADALYNRGRVREAQKDVAGAIADYRKALLTDPNHKLARTNLERLLRLPPPPPQAPAQAPPPGGKTAESVQPSAQHAPETDARRSPQPKSSPRDTEETASSGSAQPRPADGRDLTPEEADAILDSAEREGQLNRPLNRSSPPPQDHDPSRDW